MKRWFPSVRPWRLPLILSFCIPGFSAFGEEIHDPMDDAAALEFEEFFGPAAPGTGPFRREAGRRGSASAFFPAGRLGGREVFGGVKAEWMDRPLAAMAVGGDGALQRYSLLAGMEVAKGGSQESFALVSGGYHGDFHRIDRDGVGLEFLYAHLFLPAPAFKWGVGLDLMLLLDEWVPYPLLFLEWSLLDRTKLRINGDLAEVRQFTSARTCLTMGLRYNIFFGAVGSDGRYRMEAIGAELGGEYRIKPRVALRLKAKAFLWGEESLDRASAGSHAASLEKGGSLRLTLAYLP